MLWNGRKISSSYHLDFLTSFTFLLNNTKMIIQKLQLVMLPGKRKASVLKVYFPPGEGKRSATLNITLNRQKA